MGEHCFAAPDGAFGSFVAEVFRASGLLSAGYRDGVGPETRVNLMRTGRYLSVVPEFWLQFPDRHPFIRRLPVELPICRAHRNRYPEASTANSVCSFSSIVHARWQSRWRERCSRRHVALFGTNLLTLVGQNMWFCPGNSDVNLFRYSQGIIDFDAKVSHGAFYLGMAEQKLHGTQIAGTPIDQSGLGSSE